jgi:glutathione-regulated potassium-efflux system protein KefB
MGFTLTSTAVVVQILNERGDTNTPEGQRFVSILLLEDLAIVPLLAFVAFLAPGGEGDAGTRWRDAGIAVGAIAALVAAGRWLLNPMFRVLADAHAREVMTAAALLVVLGSALAMQTTGLSMAMGAFLAGVLLSESTFRHQLEADIEPFRGILLGLFFLSVGMSLDLALIARAWPLIVSGVLAFMGAKALGIYIVARLFRASHRNGLYRATLFAQGGEFAFVLYAAATNGGIFDPTTNAMLTAAVILSMALTPLAVFALRWLIPPDEQSLDGVDVPDGLKASVLIIGFGRFGQVASQSLLARGIDVSIIDSDTDMIRSAADFGFKIYYGDGTRLDLLHAAGAGRAVAIAVCIEDRDATDRIVELLKAEFPLVRLLVRSYDREHALKLAAQNVDYQIRETFESAMAFGEAALVQLGVDADEAAEISREIRRRDAERYELELAGGLMAGADLLHGNAPKPTPYTTPKRGPVSAPPTKTEAANEVG